MANSQLQLWSREVDFQSVKAKKHATTSCQLYKYYQLQERVYEFYWTGLLDSLKMWFSFVNSILRADTSYIARLYSKCVDKAFREKSQNFMLHGWLL